MSRKLTAAAMVMGAAKRVLALAKLRRMTAEEYGRAMALMSLQDAGWWNRSTKESQL